MEKTAGKALVLLERLTNRDRPWGVTELARDLGILKSNVHRLLGTLVALGYARRNPGGTYEATLKTWEIGVRVLNRLDLKAVARPHIEAFQGAIDETVHLTVLDGTEIIYIDKIESRHPIREFTRVGDRAPAHCTATGKVLLAFLDELPALGPLKSFTRTTIRDARKLKAELEQVRQQGYAYNFSEYGAYVNGAAAPIADHSTEVVAALAISGPAERLKPAALKALLPPLIATTRAISEGLGYRGALPAWQIGGAARTRPRGRAPDPTLF